MVYSLATEGKVYLLSCPRVFAGFFKQPVSAAAGECGANR